MFVSGTIAAALVTVRASAGAQSATQVVHYSVMPVSGATISQSSASASRGVKGSYAVSTNEENTKLIVSLDRPLPSGYSVTATATAPVGAESAGPISLGASASDLVRNIPPGTTPQLSFAVTVSKPAGQVTASGMRRVVFTFTSGV